MLAPWAQSHAANQLPKVRDGRPATCRLGGKQKLGEEWAHKGHNGRHGAEAWRGPFLFFPSCLRLSTLHSNHPSLPGFPTLRLGVGFQARALVFVIDHYCLHGLGLW